MCRRRNSLVTEGALRLDNSASDEDVLRLRPDQANPVVHPNQGHAVSPRPLQALSGGSGESSQASPYRYPNGGQGHHERAKTEGAAWRANVHRLRRNEISRGVSPDKVDQDRLLRKVPNLPSDSGEAALLVRPE